MSADDHGGMPNALTIVPAGYAEWLADVKSRVHAAQQRAALAVNAEVMQLFGNSDATSSTGKAEKAGAPKSPTVWPTT